MTPTPASTVLGKALAVLRAFTAEDDGVGFAELQRRTGLPKATLHRTLASLVDERLIDRRDDGYHLSGQLFQLGMLASVERTLIEVAMPFLEDLYERTHEIVHLGVAEGADVVYVARVGGHRSAKSPTRIGGRMPLHATAIGKALLAHLPADERASILAAPLTRLTARTLVAPGRLASHLEGVVTSGVAFEFEEAALGITCVAAPVLDSSDLPVAAVSVAGAVTRFRPEQHASAVRAAAQAIGATLARRAAMRP